MASTGQKKPKQNPKSSPPVVFLLRNNYLIPRRAEPFLFSPFRLFLYHFKHATTANTNNSFLLTAFSRGPPNPVECRLESNLLCTTMMGSPPIWHPPLATPSVAIRGYRWEKYGNAPFASFAPRWVVGYRETTGLENYIYFLLLLVRFFFIL